MTAERKIAVDGNLLDLIDDGPERLIALSRVIEEAQERLCLYFYIFANDDVGIHVRDGLIAALNRGVAVTLAIDSFGSGNTPDSFFAPLVEKGARFGRFGTRRSTRYLIRNHQKMVIADGVRAVIGGFNVERGYFASGDDRDGWRDLALMVEGPIVEPLQTWFDQIADWVMGDQRFRPLRRMIHRWDPGEGRLQWLIGGPTPRLSAWVKGLKADLQAAKRLDMVAAYFSPGRGMLRRLTRIARRGDARLIVPLLSDNTVTIGAARHLYKRMLRGGVRIYEYACCKLHMKLIILDDIVYIGSANFDKRSLFINVELMLRVEDADFARAVRTVVVRCEQESRPIDEAAYDRLATPFARLRWLVSYILVGVVDYTVTRRLNFRSEPR